MVFSWHNYYINIITGRQKGLIATFLRGVLRCLSWGYRLVVTCRNWAFERGFISRYRPPVPVVISVGNIVAGGTGKTPVTLLLAEEFYPNTPLAILSRGYHSRSEKLSAAFLLCKGEGPLFPAEYSGDEPYLLATRLPRAYIAVGKDRQVTSQKVVKEGVQLIILDDGMQHRRLIRDIDIVVMNAADPFGQGYLLPRGLLREHMESLERANLIVLNHIQNTEQFAALKKSIAKYTTAPVVGTRMELSQIHPLKTIQNKRVGIFCGIAHPEQFYHTVQQAGGIVVAKRYLSDHEFIKNKDLTLFAEESKDKGAEVLLCTEKDFVKLPQPIDLPLSLAWLQMNLRIVEGEAHWQALIAKVKSKITI